MSSHAPGVYVAETSSPQRTIAPDTTSVAAFAGLAPQGPADRAERLLAFADFVRIYGPLERQSWLGHAVQQFFANGGREACVVRLAETQAGAPTPGTPAFASALLPAGGAGGLYLLDTSAVNLLCVPGEANPTTLAALQAFCLERRLFLIADCAANATHDDVDDALAPLTGPAAMNSALYFPWINVADATQAGGVRAFPPSGFVAGLYARTDLERGVWKAPAGTAAQLHTAAGVTSALTDLQLDALNRLGVDCIRTLPAYGTVVWGSRTLHGADALASEWKYVPVRRLALFIERSLERGTQWTVFEPNAEPLWAGLRLAVGDFLYALFRQGAFQGTTPKDAYFVKCDAETTTQADIANGVVNLLVGFAPLKPAEFVVLRLGLRAGGT